MGGLRDCRLTDFLRRPKPGVPLRGSGRVAGIECVLQIIHFAEHLRAVLVQEFVPGGGPDAGMEPVKERCTGRFLQSAYTHEDLRLHRVEPRRGSPKTPDS